MNYALTIIAKKISAEGFKIPHSVLLKSALREISEGRVQVFYYHPVVFTVGVAADYPVVHLYSDDAGHGIMKAGRQFMIDVWDRTSHKTLVAPILSSGVKAFARRLGWQSSGKHYPTGHELFLIQRS